jgi:hypothetical protein
MRPQSSENPTNKNNRTEAEALQANVLTKDEARRIAVQAPPQST